MLQVVQSVSDITKKSPPLCEFKVGQRVRLLSHLEDELYIVVFRYGFYQQILYHEIHSLVDILKGGAVVRSVETLRNPVPNFASATAEDCRVRLGFDKPSSKFASWQFESVPLN